MTTTETETVETERQSRLLRVALRRWCLVLAATAHAVEPWPGRDATMHGLARLLLPLLGPKPDPRVTGRLYVDATLAEGPTGTFARHHATRIAAWQRDVAKASPAGAFCDVALATLAGTAIVRAELLAWALPLGLVTATPLVPVLGDHVCAITIPGCDEPAIIVGADVFPSSLPAWRELRERTGPEPTNDAFVAAYRDGLLDTVHAASCLNVTTVRDARGVRGDWLGTALFLRTTMRELRGREPSRFMVHDDRRLAFDLGGYARHDGGERRWSERVQRGGFTHTLDGSGVPPVERCEVGWLTLAGVPVFADPAVPDGMLVAEFDMPCGIERRHGSGGH